MPETFPALPGLCWSPRPALPPFKIDACVLFCFSLLLLYYFFFESELNCQVAFPDYSAYKCVFFSPPLLSYFSESALEKWSLKGICLCSWEIQMFSLARAALFMKRESRGRDCVGLSVICCALLAPPRHMSFYLAAHQPPKS